MTSVLTFIRTATHFFLVLTSLELKRQIRSYTPIAPLKAIPDSRPKWAKSIPVFRPKRPKTLSLGAAHTYMAYIREYSPSPDVAGHLILDLVDLSQNYQSREKMNYIFYAFAGPVKKMAIPQNGPQHIQTNKITQVRTQNTKKVYTSNNKARTFMIKLAMYSNICL